MKKAVFFLVMLAVVAGNAFSQTAGVVAMGYFSRGAFDERFRLMDDSLIALGFHRINTNMVPNSVHQAVWRELNRYTLRNGDAFTAVYTDLRSSSQFSFVLQITENGQSWRGWVWRRFL
jgi:hypothetical protein